MVAIAILQRRYTNSQLLAETDWLAEHMDDPNIRIVDARRATIRGRPYPVKDLNFRVHHTMLPVADLDRSIAFYTRLLGMKVKKRHAASAPFLELIQDTREISNSGHTSQHSRWHRHE